MFLCEILTGNVIKRHVRIDIALKDEIIQQMFTENYNHRHKKRAK